MSSKLQILPPPATALLSEYKKALSETGKLKGLSIYNLFRGLKDNPLTAQTFDFYVSVSAVFSSKIEGENIDLDSYFKHKRGQVKYRADYTKKIDDLYATYQFAQKHRLTEKNLLLAHKRLSKNLLPASSQGVYRKTPMYVQTPEGKIEYVAAPPEQVNALMKKFFNDLNLLINSDLTFQETFFYASLLHLLFLKIHPLADGNGRTARLLEKWFVAQRLGEKAWYIQSEKFYYQKNATYYKTIRALGLEYIELDYSKALDFLLLLPQALKMKK
jgi:Fic family protein